MPAMHGLAIAFDVEIQTVFLYIALFVFTPIECTITPFVFTPMECTKMTGNLLKR